MSAQDEINAQLEKAFERYGRQNERLQRMAIARIDETRLELLDLLAEYAKKDSTISKARVNSLLRDLDELERLIRDRGVAALNEAVNTSASIGTAAGQSAVIGKLGEAAAIGVTLNKIDRDVFQYVTNRYGDDGLVLSDRIWRFAGEQRDELNKVLRAGVIRGESLTQLTKAVRQVYVNEAWKIERLIKTEGNTAYRAATAMYSDRSDVIKGLKVNDNPGRHSRHHTHKCFEYARQNPYGWGQGVFKPSDAKIYSPHPNCTSYLTYVLHDDYN